MNRQHLIVRTAVFESAAVCVLLLLPVMGEAQARPSAQQLARELEQARTQSPFQPLPAEWVLHTCAPGPNGVRTLACAHGPEAVFAMVLALRFRTEDQIAAAQNAMPGISQPDLMPIINLPSTPYRLLGDVRRTDSAITLVISGYRSSGESFLFVCRANDRSAIPKASASYDVFAL